ncbi:MAG: TrkH family potassium uptake protein [Opitutales bacterium]
MNTPIIYRLLSYVLLILAGAFGLSIYAGWAHGEALSTPALRAFLIAAGVALLLAGVLRWLGRHANANFFRREALCAIGLTWILASLIGAIPYVLIAPDAGIASAIFESTSGLTTTGATAYANFHEFPHALLFWRSMSQWIGGIGVVVFFVALLSSLGAGAKILFSNESSGTASDFDQGRIQRGALHLLLYYLAISIACVLAYQFAGMNWFQAINHMMTTVSTGGFSTELASIEQFRSPAIEWIAIIFMCLGGTTFLFAIRLLRRQWQPLLQHHEVFWFYGILAVATLLLTFYLTRLTGEFPDHESIRTAAFQAVSIMTTTGYVTTDYDAWLSPAKAILLILMIIGGCSGSTSGGSKVIRIVVAFYALLRSVRQSFRPNATLPVHIGGRVLSERAIHSAVIFLLMIAALYGFSLIALSILAPREDFLTLVSSVQATLFNIGPGFAHIGPTENYAFFNSGSKLYLSLLMILGRLELYAVLVLFVPSVWKRFA